MSSCMSFQISKLLIESTDPALELTPLVSPASTAGGAAETTLQAFHQGNVTASRKKILPLIKSYLTARNDQSTGSTPDSCS